MAPTLDIAGAGTVGMAGNRTPFGLFKNLERPGEVFRDLGPNWFASVMGTGIVANASAVLPLQVPGLRGFATAMWGLAAALLIMLTAAWAIHWTRYTERARAHASDPQAELSLEQPHPGAGGGLRNAVLGHRAPDAAGARHAEQQVEAGQVGYPRGQRHK